MILDESVRSLIDLDEGRETAESMQDRMEPSTQPQTTVEMPPATDPCPGAIPVADAPAPSQLSYDRIDRFASEVVDSLGGHIRCADDDGDSTAIDVIAAVSLLGGTVAIDAVDACADDDDALLTVLAPRSFHISLRPHADVRSDRFEVARSLGHYLLHYPLADRPMRAMRHATGLAADEATVFADCLLLPRPAVLRALWGRETAAGLAMRFEAPGHAVRRRMAALAVGHQLSRAVAV